MKTAIAIISFAILIAYPSFIKAQGWQWATGTNGNHLHGATMSTDQLGNVFIATCSEPGRATFGNYTVMDSGYHTQALVLKTSVAGDILWAIGSQHAEVTPIKITTDKMGNAYLLGEYFCYEDSVFTFGGLTPDKPSNNTIRPLYFVAKIDPNGNVNWVKNICSHIPNGISIPDWDGAIGIDDSGNIYIAGSFWTRSVTIGSYTLNNLSAGASTVFLARYDKWGNPIWAKAIGGSSFDSYPNIAISPSGNIYFSAYSEDSSITIDNITLTFSYDTVSYSSYDNYFLAKFDNLGNAAWAKTMHTDDESGIAIDADENIYLTGYFYGAIILDNDTLTGPPRHYTTDNANLFIAKYNNEGSLSWARAATNAYPSFSYPGVSVDICGNVWVTGSMGDSDNITPYLSDFSGNILQAPVFGYNSPTFAVEYDAAGNYLTGFAIPNGCGWGTNIIADNKGSFFLCSTFAIPSITFGSYTLYTNDTSNFDAEELYIAKYDYTGPLNNTSTDATEKICQGAELLLKAPMGYNNYVWNDNTTGRDKMIDSAGEWTVYCTNICSGLSATEQIDVLNQDCDLCMVMPTSFTPNGDNTNDIFRPILAPWCQPTFYKLSVYDRWGKKVYQTNDMYAGWNGRYNNIPQDVGVYMYLLEYRTPNSPKQQMRKGDVALLR